MTVRVIYHFRVQPQDADAFLNSYAQIVKAHASQGDALGSTLLRDPEDETHFVAISRWRSKAAWLTHRQDAAHPKAYATFREVVTVTSKQCFEELLDLH